MDILFPHLHVERREDVFLVRVRKAQMEESDILELADELLTLIVDHGCRKLVFKLGPEALDCLYSVFLAKLVMIRRRLLECGGVLVLCEVAPEVMGVFEACSMNEYFQFVADEAAALALLGNR